MPYYHIRLFYYFRRKPAKIAHIDRLNLDRIYMVKEIIEPYSQGNSFQFGDKMFEPSEVADFKIVRTTSDVSSLFYDFKHGTDVTSEFKVRSKEEKKQTRKGVVASKNVFIVHGRDDKQALRLQKYLKDKLKVDAVMFDDLPDKGRTIIEQLEYIRDNVGYAFVIVTPDDVGCLTEDIEEFGKMVAGLESVKAQTIGRMFELFHTRARQNVVFELGLFMGALGRKKVCCLLKQDTEERPSDIDGILYKPFNKSVSEIFHEIPEELTEAGYEIKA